MSAFLVDPTHVDLLLEYAIGTSGTPFHAVTWRSEMAPADPRDIVGRWRTLDRWAEVTDHETGTTLADVCVRLLLSANLESVRARYGEDDYPAGTLDLEAQSHRFTRAGYILTDAEAVRACDCLAYQSCEHDGWDASEAFRILEAIREHAVSHLTAKVLAREWGAVSPPWEWDASVVRLVQSRKGETCTP